MRDVRFTIMNTTARKAFWLICRPADGIRRAEGRKQNSKKKLNDCPEHHGNRSGVEEEANVNNDYDETTTESTKC